MTNSQTLAHLRSEFREQGLTLSFTGATQSVCEPVAFVLRRMLQAAVKVGVADVSIQVSIAESTTRLDIRLRAVDRSVAIEYARVVDLASLRSELEASGGRLLQAHSRFAIFHIDLEVSHK